MSNNAWIIIFSVGILLLIVEGLMAAGGMVYLAVVVTPHYNTEVHDHMENAYYSSDPVTMRNELQRAVQGMRNLGLKEEMYSTILPWEQTPKNQMAWQYTHMASIITRVDEWEKWEKDQASSGSQQMQDVNTQKLNNVRTFIHEDGWSDDIAQAAFPINMYFTIFLTMVTGIVIFFGGICFLVLVMISAFWFWG